MLVVDVAQWSEMLLFADGALFYLRPVAVICSVVCLASSRDFNGWEKTSQLTALEQCFLLEGEEFPARKHRFEKYRLLQLGLCGP